MWDCPHWDVSWFLCKVPRLEISCASTATKNSVECRVVRLYPSSAAASQLPLEGPSSSIHHVCALWAVHCGQELMVPTEEGPVYLSAGWVSLLTTWREQKQPQKPQNWVQSHGFSGESTWCLEELGDFQKRPQFIFQEGVGRWHLLLAGGESTVGMTAHHAAWWENSSESRHLLLLGISPSVGL